MMSNIELDARFRLLIGLFRVVGGGLEGDSFE